MADETKEPEKKDEAIDKGTPVWESGLRLFLGKGPFRPMPPPDQGPPAPPATPMAAPVVTPQAGAAPAPMATPAIKLPTEPPAPVAPTTIPVTQTETTRVSGVKIPEAVKAGQADLFTQQKQTIDDQTALRQQQAWDESRAAVAAKSRQDATRADFAAQRAENDAKTKEQLTKVQSAIDDLRNAKTEPEEPGMGERVTDSIAAALGAFGSALTGAPNTALQIVENKINRRIAKARAEYERKKGAVDIEKNQLAYFVSKGLSLQQSEAAMRQLGYEDAQAELRVVAAKYGGQLAGTEGEKLQQALEEKRLNTLTEQAAISQGRVQTQSVTKNVSTAPSLEHLKMLQDMTRNDESLKQYRAARTAVDRFRNLRASGADGAALADFVAGDGGLRQGSFGPNFVDMLKKRGLWDATAEQLRAKFKGGVDPKLLDEIEAGLAANLGTSVTRAAKSIEMFRGLGAPDAMIIGGQTDDDVAAELGGKRQ